MASKKGPGGRREQLAPTLTSSVVQSKMNRRRVLIQKSAPVGEKPARQSGTSRRKVALTFSENPITSTLTCRRAVGEKGRCRTRGANGKGVWGGKKKGTWDVLMLVQS